MPNRALTHTPDKESHELASGPNRYTSKIPFSGKKIPIILRPHGYDITSKKLTP